MIKVITQQATKEEQFNDIKDALKKYPNLLSIKYFANLEGNTRFEDWGTYNRLSI